MINVRIDCDNVAEANLVKDNIKTLRDRIKIVHELFNKFIGDEETREDLLMINYAMHSTKNLLEKTTLTYQKPYYTEEKI